MINVGQEVRILTNKFADTHGILQDSTGIVIHARYSNFTYDVQCPTVFTDGRVTAITIPVQEQEIESIKPVSYKKFDNQKPDLSLLNGAALAQISKAFMDGQSKYGRYSYKEDGGIEYSRLIAAALRHITAFNDGEDCASDSGISHLAHAGANIIMLLDYISNSNGKDNRFKSKK